MSLIRLNVLPNGSLEIALTDEGREFLAENADKAHTDLLTDLFMEGGTGAPGCNGWEIGFDSDMHEATGALTGSPLISDDVTRDDEGKITAIDRVWWFPNYAVKSEIDSLRETGRVVFDRG